MGHRYEHIIAPLKIGNVVLKNRLLSSRIVSQELQGPEHFPAEATMKFIADLAKNGAAIVTCPVGSFPPKDGSPRSEMSQFYMENRRVQSYFNKMIDRVHAYSSLANAAMGMPMDVSISDIRDKSKLPPMTGPGHGPMRPMKEMTKDEIKAFTDDYTWQCVCMKTFGFDGINVYMSYGNGAFAKSLSPVYNQREDEYGGTPENRARFTLELFRSIKEACGQDFIIEAQVSPIEGIPGGFELEQWLNWCEMCEGLVDIFQLRHYNGGSHHTSPFISTPKSPFTLSYAEAFKKRGIKAVVAPGGGFQELDLIESFIKEGKTDMVTMGRAFICDSEYGKKLYSGRGEDVVPCIRCDKCHGAVCSVNPKNGLSHVMPDMFEAPDCVKKVAVIGGGPAGMKAAIDAVDRGHDVTLFEQSGYLGGQLHHADFMDFKKELKGYKDYLIRQLAKKGVKVELGKRATPELIRAGGYDAVIAACGSEALIGTVPGADGKNVWRPVDVFGNEDKLGNKIVVIGGASIGSETALYLARLGRDVTLLTRQESPAYDNPAHGREDFIGILQKETDLRCKAVTTKIEEGAVTYTDEAGEHRVVCDSVVFSAGRRPMVDECFEFAGLSTQFFVVGDSNVHTNKLFMVHELPTGKKADHVDGDVRHASMTAFFAASQI